MRAYHMPSLPEMPYEHLHEQENNDAFGQFKKMKLKILYTLDDNTFLARSNNLLEVKVARVPIPGQTNLMTLGVVSMKKVLLPVLNSSPELFGDSSIDYSVYVKDISEEDEPFVGHGLFTKLISQESAQFSDDEEVSIPGRVCSNFAALLGNKGSSETLEVKLRLARVRSKRQDAQLQQQQQQSQRQFAPSNQMKRPNSHSDTEDEEEEEFRLPKTIVQPVKRQRKSSVSGSTRIMNSNPAPKAVRTQSLPAFNQPLNQILPNGPLPPKFAPRFPGNTIADKIRQADSANQNKSSAPIYNPILDEGTIAHKIWAADNANAGKTQYNFIVGGIDEKNERIDAVEVSKRFPNTFIKKNDKKKQANTKNTGKSTSSKSPPSQPPMTTAISNQKIAPNTTKSNVKPLAPSTSIPQLPQPITMATTNNDNTNKVAPICINCKTTESKAWRWHESEEEYKRGLFCNNCFIYLIDKGVMRPAYLFKKRNNAKKKKTNVTTNNQLSTSDASTPNDTKIHPQGKLYQNSSDPIDDFNDMISSDLDFQFDPMTDIDPLPQHLQQQDRLIQASLQNQASDDKENIPPPQVQQTYSSEAIPIKKASRQNSFEKMLAKSFSGVPPNITNTPSEWMNEFFEPTPKDPEYDNTPRDLESNTPKDLATCNTLPCADESPEPDNSKQQTQPSSSDQQQPNQPSSTPSNSSNNQDDYNESRTRMNNKLKATTMPSSPLALQMGESSSPNSMNDTSDWLSEHTRLSSADHQDPNTKLTTNEELTDEQNLKA